MKIEIKKTGKFKELKQMLKEYLKETGFTNGLNSLDEFDTIIVDDEVVGFIWIGELYAPNSKTLFYIYIKPEFRRKGYARYVIKKLVDENMINFIQSPEQPIYRILIDIGMYEERVSANGLTFYWPTTNINVLHKISPSAYAPENMLFKFDNVYYSGFMDYVTPIPSKKCVKVLNKTMK